MMICGSYLVDSQWAHNLEKRFLQRSHFVVKFITNSQLARQPRDFKFQEARV